MRLYLTRRIRSLAAVLVVAPTMFAVAACGRPVSEPVPAAPAASPTAAPRTTAPPAMVPPLASFDGPAPVLAPDFTLTDQRGQRVALSSLRGAPVLLTFLYSHCVTTCPLYVVRMQAALDALDSSAQVRAVAVTVDPERDTVERLAQYTRQTGWSAGWHFVTGAPDEIKSVRDRYRISASKRELSPEMAAMGHEGYEVAHRAVVFVIDSAGQIVGVLRGTDWGPEALAMQLQPLTTAAR